MGYWKDKKLIDMYFPDSSLELVSPNVQGW